MPDLAVKIGRLSLQNPVIAASGTFGYGLEFTPFLDLDRLGGFATKGLSLRPRLGNPVPRVIETDSGMLTLKARYFFTTGLKGESPDRSKYAKNEKIC